LAYTCRLVRKALGKGARLVVCAEAERLHQIDRQLWTLGPLSFIPHAGLGATERVRQRSPVWLCTHLEGDEPKHVLVNLLDQTPEGHERFDRVIDVVSTLEVDRSKARQRWRQHAANGQTPNRFDVGAHGA
jgi:DNA polymerase-3 subunit chi